MWKTENYPTGFVYVLGNDGRHICRMDREAMPGDASLVSAAPSLLRALRIGLHHTQRAAEWTRDAYRRAIVEGMHGTAASHHQTWLDALEAVETIEAAIAKATGEV